MGACNEGMRKLLMPAEGSCTRDWEGFGDLEEGCLLMVDHVGMATASEETTRGFFKEALGADRPLQIGLTHLRLSSAEGSEGSTWPGQLYVWVENLQETWQKCRSLEARLGLPIVESAVCCHDERFADALVLREPGTQNAVVVNQAPKGYAQALREAAEKTGRGNLVCLMDLLCLLPPGSNAAARLGAFYQRFLAAKITKASEGYRLHFGAGDFLRQTFTFKEDESAVWQPNLERQVCFYLESEAQFRICFSKLSKADLVKADWKAVEATGEFSFRAADGEGVICDLRHVIRSPTHPECPLTARKDSALLGG